MPRYRNALPQLGGELFLTDGGLETTLIFHEGWELPDFAAFLLLKDAAGAAALRKYFHTYAALAQRFSTGLMEAAEGALVAKGGAEGLECAGSPSRSLGLAIKCEDGHPRAVGPAAIEVLERCGLLTPTQAERLEARKRPVLRNVAGDVVGEMRARRASLATGPPAAASRGSEAPSASEKAQAVRESRTR